LFITAIAPNLLIAKFGQDILKLEIDWVTWAKAAAVPGLTCLFILPWLVYRLYPPELRTFDNKTVSKEGLATLGPFSWRERVLAILFVLAITAWATGSLTKIDATAVAISFVAISLLTGVVTWENLVSTKGAWSTLVWYGGIVGLADGLAKAKFFDWLAKLLAENVTLTGYHPIAVIIGLVLFSLATRYLFASLATYVTAMIPVFFTLALVAQVPIYPAFFLLGFAATYGCVMTHYGGAVGPVLFGEGYVDQITWWKVGAIVALMSFIVHVAVGLPYWKLLGFW
jgi:divalent anion:Na+ symporter, DASS family